MQGLFIETLSPTKLPSPRMVTGHPSSVLENGRVWQAGFWVASDSTIQEAKNSVGVALAWNWAVGESMNDCKYLTR